MIKSFTFSFLCTILKIYYLLSWQIVWRCFSVRFFDDYAVVQEDFSMPCCRTLNILGYAWEFRRRGDETALGKRKEGKSPNLKGRSISPYNTKSQENPPTKQLERRTSKTYLRRIYRGSNKFLKYFQYFYNTLRTKNILIIRWKISPLSSPPLQTPNHSLSF